MINVWRNIAPESVRRDPLGFCDARTIDPDHLTHHGGAHSWFYYSNLLRDEAVLIKQWDSAGAFARSEGQWPDGEGTPRPRTTPPSAAASRCGVL